MKATILSDNLRTGVSLAHHAVSSRSQLPVLLNFLLEAKDGSLFISATDLEIGIRTKVAAKVEEEGSVTVPAKTFMDLVSNLTQDKVDLSLEGSVLELKGEKIRTSFPTIAAGEFPKLYEERGEKQVEFKKDEFNKEISRVVFAAATDSGRPALSGVLLIQEKEGLTIVATDGYRLSLKSGLGGTSEGEAGRLLIPARAIKELASLKDDGEKIELLVSGKNNQALFEYGSVTLVGRLIDAEYPDYQKIIPEDFGTKVVFDKVEAQNAVRTCSVFAREAANIVKMTIGKDKITFSASASSVGENEVDVEAKVEGEENEIAFNARYLLDLFGNLDEGNISFQMTGPLSPGVFKVEGDSSFLHLIMPIKVQS